MSSMSIVFLSLWWKTQAVIVNIFFISKEVGTGRLIVFDLYRDRNRSSMSVVL